MTTTYLGHIDTRNTKHQGYITKLPSKSRAVPQGLGIRIDDSLLFILSHWHSESELPQGPTFIAYPDRSLFFGNLSKKAELNMGNISVNQLMMLNGVGCFVSGQCLFYGNFGIDRNRKQYKAIGSKVAVRFLGDQKMVYEAELGQSSQNQNYTTINAIIAYPCQSQATVWQTIEQILSCKLSIQLKSSISFINHHFIQPYIQKQSTPIIQMLQSSKDYFVGFTNCQQTLGIKLHNEKVKSVGVYSGKERVLSLGRKFGGQQRKRSPNYIEYGNRSNEKVQQGIFIGKNHLVSTYLYKEKNHKSLQTQKLIRETFIKSTDFQNHYIEMSPLNQIYQFLNQIAIQIQLHVTQKLGQTLLEDSPLTNIENQSKHTENSEKQKKGERLSQKYDIQNRVYSLEQMKEEIYKNVNKKIHVGKSSRNTMKTVQGFIISKPYQQLMNRQNQRKELDIETKSPFRLQRSRSKSQSEQKFRQNNNTNRLKYRYLQQKQPSPGYYLNYSPTKDLPTTRNNPYNHHPHKFQPISQFTLHPIFESPHINHLNAPNYRVGYYQPYRKIISEVQVDHMKGYNQRLVEGLMTERLDRRQKLRSIEKETQLQSQRNLMMAAKRQFQRLSLHNNRNIGQYQQQNYLQKSYRPPINRNFKYTNYQNVRKQPVESINAQKNRNRSHSRSTEKPKIHTNRYHRKFQYIE